MLADRPQVADWSRSPVLWVPPTSRRTANRRFYDLLWSGARLVEPEKFNTYWLKSKPRALEFRLRSKG